jgi:Na+-transporting NADH:ubiquinone oxidoreductase subunit NqrD
VIVVAVLDEAGLAEVEKNLHLFSEVFIVNLTISTEEAAKAMKVSPLRKKLRGFY